MTFAPALVALGSWIADGGAHPGATGYQAHDDTVAKGSVRVTSRSATPVTKHAPDDAGTKTDPAASSAATGPHAFDPGFVEPHLRGLGEIKAKKPGSDDELAGGVRLTRHAVRVRIAGPFARTEIEETFTSSSPEVLEGILRFPIPSGARIEALALDVGDKMMGGAFVERTEAQKIWRGAIRQGTPKALRRRDADIIWVPGPWKDPALLEWQRGSRFELRVYPIPAKGSRRVSLSYTEELPLVGGKRHYSYPLPHDPAGSTEVGSFSMDVEVTSEPAPVDVEAHGYPFERATDAGRVRLTFAEKDFAPSGNVRVEFGRHADGQGLSAWASRAGAAGDARGYALLALRPTLPKPPPKAGRRFALVVDSSRSMFGQTYRLATAVATEIVAGLDPKDSVLTLACDTNCRVDPAAAQSGGSQAALRVRAFLTSITPDGGSDIGAAVASAVAAAPAGASQTPLSIVYIGDGTPTVGPVQTASVRSALRQSLEQSQATAGVSITSVGVGPESDGATLQALALAGDGAFVPYVAGRASGEIASQVLLASSGNTLRRPRLVLPEGLTEVTPQKLQAIPPGSEVWIAAKMAPATVAGEVVLTGEVGGEPFEERFSVSLEAAADAESAFVPRLFAALRLLDLDLATDLDGRALAVRLSREFRVQSRFTSLLVLESPAMFRAFGLDVPDTRDLSSEDALQSIAGALDPTPDAESVTASAGIGQPRARRPHEPGARSAPAPEDDPSELEHDGHPRKDQRAARAEGAPKAKKGSSGPAGDAVLQERERFSEPPPIEVLPRPVPRRPLRPMRRTWIRRGSISAGPILPRSASDELWEQARAALDAQPHSRSTVRRAFQLALRRGDVEQAAELAERWSEREPLDPEGLTARANVAAARGERKRAIRMLESVLDVRPGDGKTLLRLARLRRWAGEPLESCRFLMAREASAPSRLPGFEWLGDPSLPTCTAASGVPFGTAGNAARLDTEPERLIGELRLEARWDGADVDLDLAMIHPEGHRVSWLGAPTRSVIGAVGATSTAREGLALKAPEPGEYVLEIVRVRDTGAGERPVTGHVLVSVPGAERRIPFVLEGTRLTLGIARISLVERLVPVWDF